MIFSLRKKKGWGRECKNDKTKQTHILYNIFHHQKLFKVFFLHVFMLKPICKLFSHFFFHMKCTLDYMTRNYMVLIIYFKPDRSAKILSFFSQFFFFIFSAFFKARIKKLHDILSCILLINSNLSCKPIIYKELSAPRNKFN